MAGSILKQLEAFVENKEASPPAELASIVAQIGRQVVDDIQESEQEALVLQMADIMTKAIGKTPVGDLIMAQIAAELAKHEEFRSVLGKQGVLAGCVLVLQSEDLSAPFRISSKLQALRAVGNLCFDNDENRERLVGLGGISALVKAVGQLEEMSAKQDELGASLRSQNGQLVGAGVLLNVALGSDEIKKMLIEAGAVESLSWLMHHYTNERERDMALNALGAFAECEEGLKKIANSGAIPPLVRLLEVFSPDEEESKEQLEKVVALLRLLTSKDDTVKRFAEGDVIPELLKLTDHVQLRVAESSALILSTILCDDTCMKSVFTAEGGDLFLNTCLKWLQQTQIVDLCVAGGLALGNIARNDSNAAKVASHSEIVRALIHISTLDSPSKQHAALGAIKNLTVLEANRKKFFDMGVMDGLLVAVDSPTPQIQYQACSIIRSLCLNQPSDVVLSICSPPALIPRLIHLGQSEQPPVRFEACRALINFVKLAKSSQIEMAIIEQGGLTVLTPLLATTHDVIISDAILALVRLGAHEGALHTLASEPALLQSLSHILYPDPERHIPPEIKGNAIALGTMLVRRPEGKENPSLSAFMSNLARLVEECSVLPLREQAAKALALLSAA